MKSISAPSDFPIQFICACLTFSIKLVSFFSTWARREIVTWFDIENVAIVDVMNISFDSHLRPPHTPTRKDNLFKRGKIGKIRRFRTDGP